MKTGFRSSLLIFLLCAATAFLCACGSGSGVPYSGDQSERVNDSYSQMLYSKTASDPETDPAGPGSVADGRRIIKTVRETLETTAYDETVEAIRNAAAQVGGYFSSGSYSGTEESRRTANFTVRVPADRLDAFGAALGDCGTVTSYREETEDVTMAYVDVESRIAVLEAEETALLGILEKADSIASMLSVRNQLNEVQQDLASYRAQKATYDDLVSYSTVYLTVREVLRVQKAEQNFFEQVGTTFLDSLAGVGAFFRGLGVGLFGGSPYILLIGGITVGIVFLCRAIIRRNRNKKQ